MLEPFFSCTDFNIGAVKKYQHQTKVELVANYKVQEPKMWMYIQMG